MAGSPYGLLLVLTDPGGGGGGTPVASGTIMAILLPDETALQESVRIWANGVDNSGAVALDDAPQITIWTLDTSGSRTDVVSAVTMNASGSSYYYDWTPSTAGNYMIQVAGLVSAASVFNAIPVTVRPRFDPIGLAVDDVLVSRM